MPMYQLPLSHKSNTLYFTFQIVTPGGDYINISCLRFLSDRKHCIYIGSQVESHYALEWMVLGCIYENI